MSVKIASRRVPLLTLALLLLLPAAPARAVDGVIEINQAKALSGGLTPADTPGWPVTLSQRGSYRLTSDLDVGTAVGAENQTVVAITADDVTLDLNGFHIVGPNVCTLVGGAVVCTRPATLPSGFGIDNSGHTRTVVRNGTVLGTGRDGVRLSGGSCSDLRVQSTGGSGAHCEEAVRVRAEANLEVGILGGRADDCAALGNGASGLIVSFVLRSIAALNLGDGIESDGTVWDSVSIQNQGYGLSCSSGAVCGSRGNHIAGNVGGAIGGSVVQLGPSLCGTTACP